MCNAGLSPWYPCFLIQVHPIKVSMKKKRRKEEDLGRVGRFLYGMSHWSVHVCEFARNALPLPNPNPITYTAELLPAILSVCPSSTFSLRIASARGIFYLGFDGIVQGVWRYFCGQAIPISTIVFISTQCRTKSRCCSSASATFADLPWQKASSSRWQGKHHTGTLLRPSILAGRVRYSGMIRSPPEPNTPSSRRLPHW